MKYATGLDAVQWHLESVIEDEFQKFVVQILARKDFLVQCSLFKNGSFLIHVTPS